jgi:ABC-type Fe3+/spermidine/putrescine transport system ATPase subunit
MKGEPHQVYFNPTTPFVAKFFGYNIIEGVACSDHEIELAPGLRLVVARHGLQPGTPVTVCVRKEDIGLVDATHTGGLDCEIEAQIFQGGHDELVIACGQVRLRTIQPPRPMAHKHMRLIIAPERCIVLRKPTP